MALSTGLEFSRVNRPTVPRLYWAIRLLAGDIWGLPIRSTGSFVSERGLSQLAFVIVGAFIPLAFMGAIMHAQIQAFLDFVGRESNEQTVLEDGALKLAELEQMCAQNPNHFDAADRTRLKQISDQLVCLARFPEVLEDYERPLHADEVDEAVNLLFEVQVDLEGWKVVERIKKEIREMIQLKLRLPTRKQVREHQDINAGIGKLSQKPPACPKCNRPMTLRLGYTYFWGCSSFPHCWGKRELKAEEKALIPEAD